MWESMTKPIALLPVLLVLAIAWSPGRVAAQAEETMDDNAQVTASDMPREEPIAGDFDDELLPMEPRLVGKVLLGLGGSAQGSDAKPAIGGAFHYEHPIVRWFVLGGMAAVQGWTTDGAATIGLDRSVLIDVDLLPKLRHVLNEVVELHLALPIGLSLNTIDARALAGSDASLGIGWNLHALFGGQLAFTDGFGIMGDIGFMMHRVTHTVTDATPAGASTETDVDIELNRFTISAGIFLVL